jgi:HEAT repeat protein
MKYRRKLEICAVVIMIVAGIFSFQNYRKNKMIETTISNFDLNNVQNLASLLKIIDLVDVSSWIDMANNESASDRWAGVYSLFQLLKKDESLKKTLIPILKEHKESEDDNIRMLAGAGLAHLGREEGILVLIFCLESEEDVYFSQPPELLKEEARSYLKEYTDYDGINFKKWQNWWQDNQDKIFWNENTGSFELKKPSPWLRR